MNCKICGSEKSHILTKLCSNMNIMGPFFSNKESSVVTCEKCGNVYIDIDADQGAFTTYYSSEYSKSLSYFEVFGREEAKKYYEGIKERILKHIPRDSCVLEIGGGIGELAEYLLKSGFTDITVMEPSERCIGLCNEKGIKTILCDCMNVSEKLYNTFDFIIINHTLEHILDFDEVLINARKMLKDTGYMYIEVPDADQYAGTDFVPYWFFTYEHVVHFNLDSFNNLANAFGYDVVEKQSYLKCHSYNVMYAIFRKSCIKDIRYIDTVEKSVSKYIKECSEKLRPVISELEEENKKLILWGVGTSTAQLLNSNFDNCNVISLIDSNPYRQNVEYTVAGKKLKIQDPSSIEEDTEAVILILPLMYDDSIRKQIKKMGLKNQVQSLINDFKGGN